MPSGASRGKASSTGSLHGNADCAGECDPDWSPDGSSLAFYRQPSPEEEAANAMPIHILDLRNNQVRRLAGSGDRYYPRWSPDNRYLAATADHCQRIVLFDFKRQNWVEVAAEGDLYYPSWSRDGQYVDFINWTQHRSKRGYYRVAIRNHSLERISELLAPTASGTDGGWVGLAPDNSPIALISQFGAASNEIYAIDWEGP